MHHLFCVQYQVIQMNNLKQHQMEMQMVTIKLASRIFWFKFRKDQLIVNGMIIVKLRMEFNDLSFMIEFKVLMNLKTTKGWKNSKRCLRVSDNHCFRWKNNLCCLWCQRYLRSQKESQSSNLITYDITTPCLFSGQLIL